MSSDWPEARRDSYLQDEYESDFQSGSEPGWNGMSEVKGRGADGSGGMRFVVLKRKMEQRQSGDGPQRKKLAGQEAPHGGWGKVSSALGRRKSSSAIARRLKAISPILLKNISRNLLALAGSKH